MAGKKEILIGSLKQLKMAKRMAKAVKDAKKTKAEQAKSMDPKIVGPKLAKERRLAEIKKIAERNKKKKKKPQGKIVPARPNPKKKEKPAKKRRGVSRGGVQQVTRDGATDLGTPAGTKSSGSGSGKMVQSKVKKQTLATEFDALKPNAKNAERLKGKESKYAPVMEERLGTRSKKKGKPFKLAPVGTPPPGFAKGGMKKQYGTKNFMYGGSVMSKKKK